MTRSRTLDHPMMSLISWGPAGLALMAVVGEIVDPVDMSADQGQVELFRLPV